MNEQNILRFDVELVVDKGLPVLTWPSNAEFRRWSKNGHLANHHFMDLRGFEWEVAEMLLEVDRKSLERASEACLSPGGFMDALGRAQEEILEGDDEGEYEEGQFSFEAGIHGVIGALAAVGCAPLTGCAGHHGNAPHVIFWCREDRFSLIRDAAQVTGMGLAPNQDGTLEAYADWLPRIMDFAGKVLELGRERGFGPHAQRNTPLLVKYWGVE